MVVVGGDAYLPGTLKHRYENDVRRGLVRGFVRLEDSMKFHQPPASLAKNAA